MSGDLRLMAVHAHPDDESSKGAAAMARYVHEGVQVMVATCTGGERGDVLNEKLDRPEIWRDLPAIRSREMAAAREILGVQQSWLGFVDSGYLENYTTDRVEELPEDSFAREPLEVAAAPLVRLIREFRPQVITTYDEEGGYPHADHIMCHRITVEAFEAAGDPERYKEFGEPWQPSKLYYNMGFNKERMLAIHEAMLAAGLDSPYAEAIEKWDWSRDKSARVTTRVPCGEFFGVRDDALRAHATQVDPDGFWFRIPLDIQQKTWPTDDFELARSTIETSLPEDDLFAGLR
ncbi:mycothiol conjugate amidase Mca [Actinocatenispora rupis]|uniref:Mycothiol S-conjugate amidase n=1 Tax=Actinocatenispora rupis TaxID=519421 RepID=A0A8J3NB97_9ACTN|nr:mycothiol conjugate amidase Mca [Actinocatenispora rupis]GID10432.1 mycothiol S-conjugate amidase [Actinocatenispora rupis]